jgi:hypothetical protein
MLRNLYTGYITKSSTSFHPVDSPYCPFGQGGSFFKRTSWQQESEISGINLKNGYSTVRRNTISEENDFGQDIFFANDNVITKPNHRQVQRVHISNGSTVPGGQERLHGGI